MIDALVKNSGAALFKKWKKLHFPEKAFKHFPDLVDFIFKSHLHRHIKHLYYNHKIEMRPVFVRKREKIVIEDHPHLLFKGEFTPWFKIREKIQVDGRKKLYSMEGRQKRMWTYLERGLTPLDKEDFLHPQPLRSLPCPPEKSRIEIVTTHAHKEDWNCTDRFLKGTRHSFLRIVPGRGFPDSKAGLNKGYVYSFGWRAASWETFSPLRPLSTSQGEWSCPDVFEFYKHDMYVTPLDVSDEKLIRIMDVIRKKGQEAYPFHFITANCAGTLAAVLRAAEIVELDTKEHIASMWYKFLFPKAMRNSLSYFKKVIPHFLLEGMRRVSDVIYSVVCIPIFSLLGAWTTNASRADAGVMNGWSEGTAHRIKALFSNISDLFHPEKMKFHLTKKIYKWQKKMPVSYFERRE